VATPIDGRSRGRGARGLGPSGADRPRSTRGDPLNSGGGWWAPSGVAALIQRVWLMCPEWWLNTALVGSAVRTLTENPGNQGVANRVGTVRTADPSASASVFGQRGASPLQARALRPVTDGNCVLARGGGKQPEVNDQPVTKVNSIRPDRAASLLGNGEARTGMTRKPATLRGSVSKRSRGRSGGWRRDGRTAEHMKQRDLPGSQRCSLSLIRIRRAAGQESERP